jgi:indolepyruvate ferredoxin oxidoreductase beta subunit
LIVPADIDVAKLPSAKALNVAMLGRLSRSFEFSEESWQASLRANFPEKLHAANAVAFALGRA